MQSGNTLVMNLDTTGATTDDQLALMQVRYVGSETIHTLAVDNNGGGSTDALLVSLVTGTTTTTFDVDGADETAATLDALVAGISAVDGWEARRAHGVGDYTTDSDDFIDETAHAIPTEWTSVLYRDVSELAGTDGGMTARIASPNFGTFRGNGGGDPATGFGSNEGKIEILSVQGYITGATTAPYLEIKQDQSNAAGEKLVKVLPVSAAALATPEELYSATPGEGMVFHGPLLFEAGSATASNPTVTNLTIVWRPVD